MKEVQEFVDFMASYADFCEALAREEQEQYDALAAEDLPAMEQALSKQQAAQKKLGNLEKERERLQALAGFEGKRLRELIPCVGGPARGALEESFQRLSAAVEQIKAHNGKSMALVQENLSLLRKAAPGVDPSAGGYAPPGSGQKPAGGAPVFGTKI